MINARSLEAVHTHTRYYVNRLEKEAKNSFINNVLNER